MDLDPVLAAVDPDRLRAHLDRLCAFGTRHTLSSVEDPARGIGAARRWLLDAFAEAVGDRGTAGFDAHVVPPGPRLPQETEVVNVVATLPGRDPDRRLLAVAHYDTRASDPLDSGSDAPGANDDGSGTVALLELARVLAPVEREATIVLLAVAGEEQGLLGSRAHARATTDRPYEACISNDMVGDRSGLPAGARPWVRVFSEGLPAAGDEDTFRRLRRLGGEGDAPSRQLARLVAETARERDTGVDVRLVFRPDRFLRGGDHTPFLETGTAAVRFTDAIEHYHRQHQNLREEDGVVYGDRPECVDADYLAAVTRLDAAVLARLAVAPPPPPDARVVAATLERATTLRWSPSAGATGYEVVWRDTTAPGWTDARPVGDTTETRLEACRDDHLFGVRAVSPDGVRGLVSFALDARE